MDFFKRLFSAKKEKNKVDEISSAELRAWLEKHVAKEEERAYSESKPILDLISSDLEDVKTLTLGLEGLECPDGLHMKVQKIIHTYRPRFINSVLEIVSSVESTPSDFEGLAPYVLGLKSAISSLAKLNIGEGRYLPLAFGEEIDNIKRASKRLAEDVEGLGKQMGSKPALYSKALTSFDDLDLEVGKLNDIGLQKDKASSKAEEHLAAVSEKEIEIKEICSSPEASDLAAAEEELEDARNRLCSVEQELYNRLNPLRRPLKKLRKKCEQEGCSPKLLKQIDAYLKDPVAFFLSKEKCSSEEIFSELEKALDQGLMARDEAKTKKKLGLAKETRTLELKEKHSKIGSELEALEDRISQNGVLEKRKKVECEIEHLRNELAFLDDELGRLDKHRSDIEKEVSKIKERMASELNDAAGHDVRINWSAPYLF